MNEINIGIENRYALSEMARQSLRALLYSEIFSYPMTLQEIYASCNVQNADYEQFEDTIASLVNDKLILQYGDYYLTRPEPNWIKRRQAANQLATKYLRIGNRVGRFIAAFPFVRAVFISGSLSKNIMTPDGDIDFFVITKPGRLWLARTLLVFFKKIFLLNSHKYFCVNYFIDEKHLCIEEQNLFTATEVCTLIPVYGQSHYYQFMEANDWTMQYYPNFPQRDATAILTYKATWLKPLLESMLGGQLGERLDAWCMQRTVKHWHKKFSDLPEAHFDNALKSRQYVSKHHPQQFQQKVMQQLAQKIADYEQRYDISIR